MEDKNPKALKGRMFICIIFAMISTKKYDTT